MAKAIPWSEWIGNSKEKLFWAYEYLSKKNVHILLRGTGQPEDMRKGVIDALKRRENDLEGREILRRMKNTYASKELRRSKRFKGFVSSTIGMRAPIKEKLIALQKLHQFKSQEETIEFLIENAAEIDQKLEETYKSQIAELKKRIPSKRASTPNTNMAGVIQNVQAMTDVNVLIKKFKKDITSQIEEKFKEIEKMVSQEKSGTGNTNQEDSSPSQQTNSDMTIAAQGNLEIEHPEGNHQINNPDMSSATPDSTASQEEISELEGKQGEAIEQNIESDGTSNLNSTSSKQDEVLGESNKLQQVGKVDLLETDSLTSEQSDQNSTEKPNRNRGRRGIRNPRKRRINTEKTS